MKSEGFVSCGTTFMSILILHHHSSQYPLTYKKPDEEHERHILAVRSKASSYNRPLEQSLVRVRLDTLLLCLPVSSSSYVKPDEKHERLLLVVCAKASPANG
jgi:hypothetical protein